MDKLKDMAGGFNPGDIQKFTEGVSWPIGKDDLAAILKQKGAPDSVVSKVQDSDASEFKDQGDVLSRIGM